MTIYGDRDEVLFPVEKAVWSIWASFFIDASIVVLCEKAMLQAA